MRVEIVQVLSQWCIVCTFNGQVLWALAADKLIEAIDLANTLQIHVDNIDSLPLNQYSQGA